MSVAISIENVIKRFGKDTIINGLSLDVRPGEFFTLLGPSGCGKTTLLRMIIGFNSIEGGEIKIDGKVINNIPTNKRNMGMVFQNYAIFPHMSVRDNVAFGLKNRKVPQDQIESQVDEILKVVKIDHLKKRMPSKLSGGQQQRVALARAIYVTHDQEEALAVSDRIAVMNGGVIQQIDTPKNVYQRPSNIFVSTFIGLSNIMDGRIEARDGQTLLHIGDYSVPMENLSRSAQDGQAVKVSIRPEEFIISREDSGGIPAVVRSSVFLGITTHYFVETADGREMEVIQNSDIWDIIPDHTPIRLGVQPHKINVFTEDGSQSLIVRRDHS